MHCVCMTGCLLLSKAAVPDTTETEPAGVKGFNLVALETDKRCSAYCLH